MPNVYNGGTANFAALMPYQNFAQKAAYKQQEVAYLNEINRIEDEKMARVNDMQKNIADSAAALAAMPVEPQDVSRLRTEIESKTADILKEMRTSGDPESWLRNNGRTAAVDLTRKVLTGDVLPNMTINKASMAKINDDLANGRKIRPMDVVMADGSVQKLDSKTAIEKFRNKEAIRIQYDSGYDVPDVSKVMQFTATNDNPDYYYAKDKNTVTFNQYKNLLSRDVAAKNMSEQELDAFAKETYNPGFKWNNNDIRYREMALNEQRANRVQRQTASGGGDNLYNQSFVRPVKQLEAQFLKNNDGKDIPPRVTSDANALTRIISGNDKIGKGVIPISAKKEGVYVYDKVNKRYLPVNNGPNTDFQFEPDGTLGYMKTTTPGGMNNGMAGGAIVVPATIENKKRSRNDVAKEILFSFGVGVENEADINAALSELGLGISKDPEKIGGDLKYRVTGISTGIVPHRDDFEYQNRVNVTGGTNKQEGLK